MVRESTGLEWVEMSNDISTKYTDDRNKTAGRKGYLMWKSEKCTAISPKEYEMFLQKRRRKS